MRELNLWDISEEMLAILDQCGDSGEVTAEQDAQLTALTDDFSAKVSSIVRYLDGINARIEVTGRHIGRLKDAKAAAIARHRRLREYLAACMRKVDARRLQTETHTVNLMHAHPHVEITCETDIPDEFKKHSVSVDTAKIKERLKEGATIPGAVLMSGPDYVRIS